MPFQELHCILPTYTQCPVVCLTAVALVPYLSLTEHQNLVKHVKYF